MKTYEKKYTVKWAFREYKTSAGRCAVSEWRLSLTVEARAALDSFLKILAKLDRWGPPDLKPLKGSCAGLTELRWKHGNVQHRLIGAFNGARVYVLLIGCTHKQQRYDPAEALETAARRAKQIERGEASTCEYRLVAHQ